MPMGNITERKIPIVFRKPPDRISIFVSRSFSGLTPYFKRDSDKEIPCSFSEYNRSPFLKSISKLLPRIVILSIGSSFVFSAKVANGTFSTASADRGTKTKEKMVSKVNPRNSVFLEFIKLFVIILKFSFPKNMVRADVFSRFLGSFYRCGSAAFSEFCGGLSSPPAAAKCVQTILRIQHHVGNFKRFWFASLRSATNLYWIWG